MQKCSLGRSPRRSDASRPSTVTVMTLSAFADVVRRKSALKPRPLLALSPDNLTWLNLVGGNSVLRMVCRRRARSGPVTLANALEGCAQPKRTQGIGSP